MYTQLNCTANRLY